MKNIFVLMVTFCLMQVLFAQTKGKIPYDFELNKKSIKLPNGWSLSPAGHSLPLGDLPLNVALSPSGQFMAVTNNGVSTQTIDLIDVKKEKVVNTIIIPESWYGLAFLNDHTLYASGGNLNIIFKYRIENNKLQLADSIVLGKKWPNKISPAGIAIDRMHKILYVATKENNSLYIVDLNTHAIIKQLNLGAEGYACLLSPDHSILFVSLWGANKVALINTQTQKITNTIEVGSNPNEMVVSKNGHFLFVANSNDNSVSVIDVKENRTIETLNAALFPQSLIGSTTDGLALSENGKRLYVANADNNCLAVFDVSEPGHSVSKGFIPVGWYPTNVKVIDKKIFVSNGKGFSSFPDPYGPYSKKTRLPDDMKHGVAIPNQEQYIGSLFTGTLSIINEPNDQILSLYSKQVYQNTPYTKRSELTVPGERGNPIPMKTGGASPLKYVFYILKENRTYDQILGDMPKGNGDTSLVLFGQNVTINQHSLADSFVLLDNFFVDGEVSADGHNWSMSAYANDYNEKTWPTSYGGRGGTYDYAGNRAIGLSKKGYIWDNCIRHHVSMRNYGEFADDGKVPLKSLDEKTCYSFPHWDLSIQDVYREKIWEHDFDSLLAINKVPHFNIVYFPNDHTSGQSLGAYSPRAAVADNDLAVGRFVEHLSHSTVWGQSAVFVVEDDAQDGPDHVDAHRTTAYIFSPYVKRNFVDHTAYTTSGMIRTMELILGIPSMSQYDAAAVPMWRCFTMKKDTSSFTALNPLTDINERNTKHTKSSRVSMNFDFSREDLASPFLLNETIWKSVKGGTAIMPSPEHSAFLNLYKKTDDD